MKQFLPSHFEELKKKVLNKVGIKEISPSDCYRLAVDISNATHKQISETTMKRIYGFAVSRYKPSSFTLNAMADFCGYDGWSGFLSTMENQSVIDPQHRTWETVASTAHKITRFTLETNKQKSGIPFEYTIDRQQLHRHISAFEQKKANVCLISAPAGSGKTIGITRWIEQQLSLVSTGESQSIYLFINGYSLLQVTSGYDGGRWLAQILGMYKEGSLNSFLKSYKTTPLGRFYLIIDDLNNDFFNNKHFNLVISQLIDMSAFFSSFDWFKLILTMRPSTWQTYKHLIEGSKKLYRNWYIGFNSQSYDDAVNLYPFNMDEIHELTNKITGRRDVPSVLFTLQYPFIKLPLYFQYYYQLKKEAIEPASLTMADQFAIVGQFINKYVLKGSRYIEKQLLAEHLLGAASYSKHTICISKEQIYATIKQHHTVYRDLLQTGIIYEYHVENRYCSVTEIRFQSALAGAYFIAKNLIRENNQVLCDKLLALLRGNSYPSGVKNYILKWLIIFSLESGDLHISNYVMEIHFPYINSSDIAAFICQAMVVSDLPSPTSERISHQLNNTPFIEKLMLHGSVKKEFANALHQLLRFNLNNKNKSQIHALLGLIAFFKLDDVNVARHIEAMHELRYYTSHSSVLNPLHGLETLHRYFKYGTLDLKALRAITRFCFSSCGVNTIAPPNELSFTIALFTTFLTNNPHKTIRLVNVILKLQADRTVSLDPEFVAMCCLFRNMEYLGLGKPVSPEISAPHNAGIRKIARFNKLLHILVGIRIGCSTGQDVSIQLKHLFSVLRFEEFAVFEVYLRLYLLKAGYNGYDHHETELRSLTRDSGYRLDCFATWVDSTLHHVKHSGKDKDNILAYS